jgi:hypothetical protein
VSVALRRRTLDPTAGRTSGRARPASMCPWLNSLLHNSCPARPMPWPSPFRMRVLHLRAPARSALILLQRPLHRWVLV